MALQDRLDAFKLEFKAGKPPYCASPDIHPIMERATAELIASRQAARAIKAGDRRLTAARRSARTSWRSRC